MQHKRCFLVYVDDNDQKKEAFIELLESNPTYIKFATNRNVITLPFSRVIKLKEERNNAGNENDKPD